MNVSNALLLASLVFVGLVTLPWGIGLLVLLAWIASKS